MKILITTGIYPPDIGGPATYSNLIQTELNKRGHQAVALTYGRQNVKCQMSNVKCIDRKYPLPVRYFLYFLKVLKLGKNVDIIYVQDPVSVGLPTTLANWFLKKKLILKIVGDYSWEIAQQVPISNFQVPNLDNFYPFERKKYPFKIWLLHKIEKWVAKRADKIITPSFYLKNILIKDWGIVENKIKVIYNSFDVPSVIARSEATRQSQPFKILSVGRLVPWKGFIALIGVIERIPDVSLEIVGSGPEEQNLKFKILDHVTRNTKIDILGSLPHAEVVKKMRSSDLLVLNSAYEGLSHVILEAMAVGLPVAVSRVGGNIELVGENEERGYLFEYDIYSEIEHKINYIIAHPEEAKEGAQKARDFVADFSKDKMISELEKTLN